MQGSPLTPTQLQIKIALIKEVEKKIKNFKPSITNKQLEDSSSIKRSSIATAITRANQGLDPK